MHATHHIYVLKARCDLQKGFGALYVCFLRIMLLEVQNTGDSANYSRIVLFYITFNYYISTLFVLFYLLYFCLYIQILMQLV